ncbi:LCP family protein [Levilactobacillus bambusae]|uniref:LytR family transcriptional regulator n=1 Tax=Levilactobacillus bambusae TaxID=2024736 RepID=A0A2V1MZ42_9LACO|nr:LCP family protein [Levilactobacillus bambusae]PWF99359.1 LytR family transcriptional regulator [Levilactobacillus bambusae]
MRNNNKNDPKQPARDFQPVYESRSARHAQPHSHEKQSDTTYVHPHRPMVWTVVLMLLVLSFGGLSYAYSSYKSAKNTFSTTYQGTGSTSRNVSAVIKSGKPFNILLLGTDGGALGRGKNFVTRTDTIIVATINPQKEKVTLTSIPRDTRVLIAGTDNDYEKINAAYPIAGASGTMKTVQNLLKVPIDYFVLINMGGLEKMVNSVDGIDVNPLLTFKYEDVNVKKGQKTHLNGQQALNYSRMRDEDPLGDYGRQKRQRQVIKQLALKAINISSITRLQTILKSLDGNLKTDMSFNDMISIRTKYGDASHHMQSQTLQGSESYINGSSYQIATIKELQRVSNSIRGDLDLDDKTITSQYGDDSSASSSTGESDTTSGQYQSGSTTNQPATGTYSPNQNTQQSTTGAY